MDALAAVLAVAGVQGTVAATVNAAEPWGLTLNAVPGAAFHAVTQGTAMLRVVGQAAYVKLLPGDLVLLPTGVAHTLASEAGAPMQPIDHVAAEQALATGGELTIGTGVARTRILCASYHQDPAVRLPLLNLLPEVLHLSASQADIGIDATLRLLAYELSEPGLDWTVDSLAADVGVSRATLARRFISRTGDSPAAFLTRWRMDVAARRLRDTDDTVAAIAHSLGYTSEFAFNRAFTRERRISPGRYRKQSRHNQPS